VSDPTSSSPTGFYLAVACMALAMPLLMGSASSAAAVLVFGIAAAACNLLLGYAGQLSFAQGAFFGAGSYGAGLLLKAWPGLGVAALPLAALAGASVAAAVGLLSVRQRGIYGVMITLAMGQLAFFAALSFPQLTGGENGLLDIPRPVTGLEGWLGPEVAHYVLVALGFAGALALLRRVLRSSFGRILDAIRENEVRAATAGYDVRRFKLLAFCLSGGVTGLAGALYATQLRSAPLSSIDLATSEMILIMSILGGRRSLPGAVLGAMAMTLMAEHLSAWWPRWQMLVGMVLIGAVLFAPNGLAGLAARWRRRLAGGPAREALP